MRKLFDRIDAATEEAVTLTQDLIRIPTVNPPGDAYTPCAELLGERLRKAGFDVLYERGVGTPGDSDRHPRTNVVARLEGRRPGPCLHFNGHGSKQETFDCDQRSLSSPCLFFAVNPPIRYILP